MIGKGFNRENIEKLVIATEEAESVREGNALAISELMKNIEKVRGNRDIILIINALHGQEGLLFRLERLGRLILMPAELDDFESERLHNAIEASATGGSL